MRNLATCICILFLLTCVHVQAQVNIVSAFTSAGHHDSPSSNSSNEVFLTGSFGIPIAGDPSVVNNIEFKSGYMGVISQLLLVNEAPTFSYNPPSSISSTTTILIDVEDASPGTVEMVEIFARPIGSEEDFEKFELTLVSGNTYSYTVETGNEPFNAMGMEYYFMAEDNADKSRRNPILGTNLFLHTGVQDLEFPTPTTYETERDYRIISIPYDIGSNQVTTLFEDIFDETTGYDNTQWRLFGYEGGDSFVEFPNGDSDTFTRGNAYWFGIRASALETISLNAGAETVAPAHYPEDESLFQLTLSPGWNMVGNPYTIAINWTDIRAYNENSNVGVLYTFSGEYEESATLEPFKGGVVFLDGNDDVTLKISFPGQTNTSSSRIQTVSKPLSEENEAWQVQFQLSQNGKLNRLPKIGMHPAAETTKDALDRHHPPRFQSYLELNSLHPEHPEGTFSSDIVPVSSDYSWDMVVESDTDEEIIIRWSNSGQVTEELYLLDKTTRKIVDMKNTQTITVPNHTSLKVIYGKNALDHVEFNTVQFSDAYPNPILTHETLWIPWMTNIAQTQVSVDFYDMEGKKVDHYTKNVVGSGSHAIQWTPISKDKTNLNAGIYFYHAVVSTHHQQWTTTGKILITP